MERKERQVELITFSSCFQVISFAKSRSDAVRRKLEDTDSEVLKEERKEHKSSSQSSSSALSFTSRPTPT